MNYVKGKLEIVKRLPKSKWGKLKKRRYLVRINDALYTTQTNPHAEIEEWILTYHGHYVKAFVGVYYGKNTLFMLWPDMGST